MAKRHDTDPELYGDQMYLKGKIEDIDKLLEDQGRDLRKVREDFSEVKGELKGITQKIDGLCTGFGGVKDEISGHQKKIALNKSRITSMEDDLDGKVDCTVCEKESGKVMLLMRIFCYMLAGTLIVAALKVLLGFTVPL